MGFNVRTHWHAVGTHVQVAQQGRIQVPDIEGRTTGDRDRYCIGRPPSQHQVQLTVTRTGTGSEARLGETLIVDHTVVTIYAPSPSSEPDRAKPFLLNFKFRSRTHELGNRARAKRTHFVS
jgi:hypothetical protein